MNLKVKIQQIKTVNELSHYWTNEDFIQLLDRMNLPDAAQLKQEELKEMLYMAATDFEPEEAAEIILTYKLGDRLTPGQIQTISHEMMDEKVAEQYADPSFHYDLFNINQLLYKAFKGKFPNTEASVITLDMTQQDGSPVAATKEILTKAISAALSDRSIIMRLYDEQMTGQAPFGDAEKIIWRFTPQGEHTFEVVTSRYWIEKDDLESDEYDTVIRFFDGETE